MGVAVLRVVVMMVVVMVVGMVRGESGGEGSGDPGVCHVLDSSLVNGQGWARKCEEETLPPKEYRIISLAFQQVINDELLADNQEFHTIFCPDLPAGISKPPPTASVGSQDKIATFRAEIPSLYILNLVSRALKNSPYKGRPVCISTIDYQADPKDLVNGYPPPQLELWKWEQDQERGGGGQDYRAKRQTQAPLPPQELPAPGFPPQQQRCACVDEIDDYDLPQFLAPYMEQEWFWGWVDVQSEPSYTRIQHAVALLTGQGNSGGGDGGGGGQQSAYRLRLLQDQYQDPPNLLRYKFHILIDAMGVDSRYLVQAIDELYQGDVYNLIQHGDIMEPYMPIMNGISTVGQGSQVFLTNCKHLNQSRLPPKCKDVKKLTGDYETEVKVTEFPVVNCWSGMYDRWTESPWPTPVNEHPGMIQRLIAQSLEQDGVVKVVCLTSSFASSPSSTFTVRLRPTSSDGDMKPELVKAVVDKAGMSGIILHLNTASHGSGSGDSRHLNAPLFLLTLLTLFLPTI